MSRNAIVSPNNVALTDVAVNKADDKPVAPPPDGKLKRTDWKLVITIVDRVLFGIYLTSVVITVSVLFPR